MKKRVMTPAIIAVSLFLVFSFSSAWAEETSVVDPGNFSASVWLTTDYVFRGVSNSDQGPAIQGSFDYAHPVGFYAGVWASNSAFNDNGGGGAGGIEVDYYAGFANAIGNFGYDIAALYYTFPNDSHDWYVGMDGGTLDPSYFESHLGLTYTWEPATIGGNWNWSPDFFGEDGDGNALWFTLDFALPKNFSIGGEYGVQDVKGDKLTNGYDYNWWRIGLGWELFGYGLDLSYWDSDYYKQNDLTGGDPAVIDALQKISEDRIVFTISRSF
jgi:uncharacterized protein (TIGR02001 family)